MIIQRFGGGGGSFGLTVPSLSSGTLVPWLPLLVPFWSHGSDPRLGAPFLKLPCEEAQL